MMKGTCLLQRRKKAVNKRRLGVDILGQYVLYVTDNHMTPWTRPLLTICPPCLLQLQRQHTRAKTA